MNYDYVAIPSYGRTRTICAKTLALLARLHVPPEKTSVFVANGAEAEEYAKVLPDGIKIVVGVPGIGNQRNYIHRHYPEGVRLLSIDDDITDLQHMTVNANTGKRQLTSLDAAGLDDICAAAYCACERFNARLWGIYPNNNRLSMYNRITTDLRLVVAGFYGVINSHDPKYRVSINDKEDYERTILHYIHDGAVVRVNDICFQTRYYEGEGGMQVTRTTEIIQQSVMYLLRTYPDYCEPKTSRNHRGKPEVNLKDMRARKYL